MPVEGKMLASGTASTTRVEVRDDWRECICGSVACIVAKITAGG